tara:strand:+ start:4721 stop:5203 length:483 start_codon:yes stop_codon:yes gene_type:complete
MNPLIYRTNVETLSENKSDAIFHNRSAFHAEIVYEALFDYAKSSINIFCESLDDRVFGSDRVLKATTRAIQRSVRISVIYQDRSAEDSRFFKKFNNYNGLHKVSLKFAPEHLREQAGNFAVVDSRAFRLEPDKSTCEAFVSFNRPALAEELEHFFKKNLT